MGLLVDGKWTEEDPRTNQDGKFVRKDSVFRNWITADGSPGPTGDGGFKAEAGRYHLYVTHNCPWAYRTMIFRKLKRLEDMIGVSIACSSRKTEGWTYDPEEDCIPDTVNGATYLHEVYAKADPHYTGRVTVPTVWDKRRNTIVSNESSEIIRMFNSAFNGLAPETPDYNPRELRAEIEEINAFVYERINNGVYRAGFSGGQEAYDEAFDILFDALDVLDKRLGGQRYLVGDRLTEADWRLFATLIRFDVVYYGLFKCNKRHVYEYPNLWNYTLELYQHPGIADITFFKHIKRGYYNGTQIPNPTRVVPSGPALDYWQAHDRGRFPAAKAA
jgi:putative glutathione S-transferase